MIAPLLARVLEATGYLSNGQPAAASVTLAGPDTHTPSVSGNYSRLPSFFPDAWWRSNAEPGPWSGDVDLRVYFKFVEKPMEEPVAEWQKEIWNQGFSPLLWVVSPQRIDLYNGFGEPRSSAVDNRLETFSHLEAELARLDAYAGRLAMETGQFWRTEPAVNRNNTVDTRLLRRLAALERNLVGGGLDRAEAQGLIGRSIFAQYLLDRDIIAAERLHELAGRGSLPEVFDDREAAMRLFGWLRETFNGDMFPQSEAPIPEPHHIGAIAEFLRGTDPEGGQMAFFPYRFDVIPVELISAIYEQFVHAAEVSARKKGVYYTPISAVSLVLDEVFEGLTGHESVLDLACGSGIFLVEAMRRLVRLRSSGEAPGRETVRSVLHNQIHGVDIMPEAVHIAAFSLYLAALELDPDPKDLRFEPLIGRTLRVANAFEADFGQTRFDVIVGNPPWSFRGKGGTEVRRARSTDAPRQPRGESLDFVRRAMKFKHETTRFGMILSATPFFSRSTTGLDAAQSIVEALAPVTLVNLSELSEWLFPKAKMPAIALLACGSGPRPDGMTLVQARWSESSACSHVIEVAPSDIATLPISSWKRNAGLFKASFLGRRHDLLLLDDLRDSHETLEARLSELGTRLRTGVTLGNRSRDAGFLEGLPFAQSGIRLFDIPENLPTFDQALAERPRELGNFVGPLLVVGEYLQKGDPRAVAAVSERDLVFSNAYFGASFANAPPDAADLLAGILGSAMASWYFLMTGSTFGIWIQRLARADLAALPMPELQSAIASDAGRHVVSLVRTLHQGRRNSNYWSALDDAVFDLYQLDDEDRVVVRDGLFRASWQWKPGRLASVMPAELDHLRDYARIFLGAMDAWLSGAGHKRMRAEILQFPSPAPLRVIRFVLENAPGPSTEVEVVSPNGALSEILSKISERASVQVSEYLVGIRDLRVNSRNEVSIIKPSARRNWLAVHALEDADAVVEDSLHGADTA